MPYKVLIMIKEIHDEKHNDISLNSNLVEIKSK